MGLLAQPVQFAPLEPEQHFFMRRTIEEVGLKADAVLVQRERVSEVLHVSIECGKR